MSRFGVGAWILATLLSVWIASQAVALVREEVTQPRSPATTDVVAGQATTVPSLPTTTATTTTADVGTTAPPATLDVTTTAGGSTTSTTLGPGGSSPATTAPATTATPTTVTPTTAAPPTSSTTAPPPPTTQPPQQQTHQLVGGWVRINVGDGVVTLDGAAPAVGFTMNVRATGPLEVDVRFESEDHESRFEAEWEDGELKIDKDED